MAACALCKKGLREQFVAQSNGSEYVHCSNGAYGYFCAVQDCVIQIPIPQVTNNNFINSFYFHQSLLKAIKHRGKGKERNFIKGANLLMLEDLSETLN